MESSWAHFSGDVPLSWPQPVSLFPQLCARLCLGGNLKYEMEIHWSWQLQRGERGWSLACLFGVQATPLISGSGCPKRQEGKERENCSERSGRRRHGMGSRKPGYSGAPFLAKGGELAVARRSKRMLGGRELLAPGASANCAPTTPKDLGPGTVLGGAVRARSCVWMTPARRHLATYPRSYRAPQKLLR